MPIRIDNNSKRKYLCCEEDKHKTGYEQYIRINKENEFKEKKRSDRAIKKLKKEGKVRSICGFLAVKEDKEDDWTKSKKDEFLKNRSIRRSTLRARNSIISKCVKKPMYSDI